MELQQMRDRSAGRNRLGDAVNVKSKANLGQPPSSKFNLSILRPKWTRNLRRGDSIATRQGVDERSSRLQRQQNRKNAVEAPSHNQKPHSPVSDPARDEGDHGKTTQQTHMIKSNMEPSGVGDTASMEPSPVSGTLPTPQPLEDHHYTSAFASNACVPLSPGTSELRDLTGGKEAVQSANPDQDSAKEESSRDAKDASRPKEREEANQDIKYTAATAEDVTTSDPEAELRRDQVKQYVWEILTHRLRGAERISGSVVVETELHGCKQILVVKCYGRAAARAKEIHKLLSSVVFDDYTLAVRPESQFDTDLTFLAEPNISIDAGKQADTTPTTPAVLRTQRVLLNHATTHSIHTTNTYQTHLKADQSSNAPYWNSTSYPVDCLLPRGSKATTNTLCGALVRMMGFDHAHEHQLRVWTCGGIVNINGVPYALTTAHPFVLGESGKEPDEKTKPSVTDYILPKGAEVGAKTAEEMHEPHNWRRLGRVYMHAVSMGNRVPANCDWLLIDITKDFVLPNTPAELNQNFSPKHQPNHPGSVTICTWRGSLSATLQPGSSFLILGESSFKAMKISVDQPMVQGDSGSWIFKCEEVHGVVIAGSTEASGEHYAYAISMTDMRRHISVGMGNAFVHVPTPIENAITAHKVAHHGQDTAGLAALYIKQMVQEVARNGSRPMDPRLSNGASPCSSNTNALLTLARICPPVKPFDIPGTRLLDSLFLKLQVVVSGKSLWHELGQYDELRNIAGLSAIAFSIDPGLHDCDAAELIQHTMTELGIFPQPSKDKLGLLVRQLGSRHLLKLIRNGTPFVSAKDGAHPVHLFIWSDSLRADASKLLARLFYAVDTRRFFVYCGPWALWLHQLSNIVELRVIMVGADFDRSILELQAKGKEHWDSQIQVFVIPESQLDHYSKNVEARFSAYGDVVEHHELRDLLWRLANSR